MTQGSEGEKNEDPIEKGIEEVGEGGEVWEGWGWKVKKIKENNLEKGIWKWVVTMVGCDVMHVNLFFFSWKRTKIQFQ